MISPFKYLSIARKIRKLWKERNGAEFKVQLWDHEKK
jgi:hypothetical protein